MCVSSINKKTIRAFVILSSTIDRNTASAREHRAFVERLTLVASLVYDTVSDIASVPYRGYRVINARVTSRIGKNYVRA